MYKISIFLVACILASSSASFFDRVVCAKRLVPSKDTVKSFVGSIFSCSDEVGFDDDVKESLQNAISELTSGNLVVNPMTFFSEGSGDPVADLMESLGLTDQIKDLRICMTRMAGDLTDAGEFDTAKFAEKLLSKVRGSSVEENTKAGVENCGEVQDFKMYKYLLCVVSYCTGDNE